MRQTIAKMIGVAAREYLGFPIQSAKSAGVDDAIPIALKIIAVGMRWLGMAPSARLLDPHCVIREHEKESSRAKGGSVSSAVPARYAEAWFTWCACLRRQS